jgi:protein-S-isoprenylcysteine O-methyltransferase Ste14
MRRTGALLGSLIFLVLAPGSVAGLIPWWITDWKTAAAFSGKEELRLAGFVLLGLGLVPLLESFARFALIGLGTPAPIAPTSYLVVSGFYRYVRNPMYAGVVTVIFGQALVFADLRLLAYAVLVWLTFELFVLIYEEPVLERTYGEEYARYRTNVPRWIPRFHNTP